MYLTLLDTFHPSQIFANIILGQKCLTVTTHYLIALLYSVFDTVRHSGNTAAILANIVLGQKCLTVTTH